MKLKPRYLEYIWHVIALTLLAGAFVPLWRWQSGIVIAQGDPVQQTILLGIYICLGLLFWHRRLAVQIALKSWLLWLLIGLTFVSILWSQVPALTLRRSVALLLATLYGLLLTVRFPPTVVLRLFGAAMAIIVLASAISIGIGAQWAVMEYPHQGAWQGVMLHKNALGRICVLALIVTGILAQCSAVPWRLFWAGVAIGAIVLIIGSGSATALVMMLFIIAIWLIVSLTGRVSSWARQRMILLGMTVMLPIGALGLLSLEEILNLLGRDIELTGRVPLWLTLLPIGWQQPLLGYGFGAFWVDPMRETILEIALMRSRFRWAEHAHNGYLDVWLELGSVGVLLALLTLFIVLHRSLRSIGQPTMRPIAVFIVLLASYLLGYNLSEAIFLEGGLAKALFWVMFSYSYFVLASDTIISRQRSEANHSRVLEPAIRSL